MDYEDKVYWLEEIRRELGVLWEEADDPDQLDDYQDMLECINHVMDDLFRLEQLDK